MTDLNKIIIDYNKGTEYLSRKNYKKALPLLKKVLKQYNCKEANTNIGNCYRAMDMDALMFKHYNEALKDNVPFLDLSSETDLHAYNNLGLATFMYGNDDEAIELYRKAIERKPEFWDAWWNCSTATLRKASSGQIDLFPTGWEMYKSRFLKPDPVKVKNKKEGLVYWDGISRGESFIALVEQGIGDIIMWGRFLKLLPFKKIYVQCDPSLDDIIVAGGFIPVRDAIDTCAEYAYPMCSLGEFYPNVPPGDWLYNFGDAYDFGTGFNVGIVWAGSPTHANDRHRSTSINRFHKLAKNCNLYSLTPGFNGNHYVKSLDIKSWTDTANYIQGLDLVISVDTSVAHLAASMGREVWLLQPYKETDFRWGTAFSSTSCPITTTCVWYNNVRIFSNPQSWEFVFKNVEDELVKRIAS